MNTSTQLKAQIRNLSKKLNIEAEVLHRNYMLERFLERIALSSYKDKFILKGGMLIASISGIDTRSTKDMDTTVIGISLKEKELENIINEILSVPVDDGVIMKLAKFESIRDESEYPGIRASIISLMDKTKQTIKIDITTGDRITPRAIEFSYKLMMEDRTISVLAYNLETIIAEKMETILSRGIASTRLRDFYDIYILMLLKENDFNDDILSKAFKETSKYRGTYESITSNGDEYINLIQESENLARLWEQYRSKNEYASSIEWADTLISVRKTFNRLKSN